jgi:hypothetical protein
MNDFAAPILMVNYLKNKDGRHLRPFEMRSIAKIRLGQKENNLNFTATSTNF